MIFKNSITSILVFLFAVVIANAQTTGSVITTVDKNKIEIGKHLQLNIKYSYPSNATNKFILPDTIPHFEIMQSSVIDSATAKGFTTVNRQLILTSFDSGKWTIPAFSLAQKLQSKAMEIEVVFSDFNPEQPYHDIKDILPAKPLANKTPWWWYTTVAIILLLAIAAFVAKKKKVVPAKVIPRIDAFQQSMQQLEALRKQSLSKKEYYAALATIFREYLVQKKGVLSLQKTTDDLLLQLKNTGWFISEFETFSTALRTTDWVKFAKYIPTTQEDENVYKAIKQAIITINNT
jgi:hypothetical protein